MEIKREYYLDKLIKRQNNGLIKVITGIRRCGKSYLLNTLFYNYLIESGIDKEHIICFAFDSADALLRIGESLISIEKEKRGVNPELFMEYIRSQTSGEGKYYLLLDEVQLLDCFESVLNGYLRKDNMYPLSFAEFMSVYKGDKYEGLSEYMLYGGIPLVVLREGANEKAAVLQKLFDEIYITDIFKRNRVETEAKEKNRGIKSSITGASQIDGECLLCIKTTFCSKMDFRQETNSSMLFEKFMEAELKKEIKPEAARLLELKKYYQRWGVNIFYFRIKLTKTFVNANIKIAKFRTDRIKIKI